MGRNSRLLTTIGVAFSFLSWVSSLLSFLLPYWVYVDEKLIAPKIWRMSSTEMIQLRYNYGFWKYCSSMISSTVTSHVCGDIVTHQVWEQFIICMVLLASILQLNSSLNASLFLLIFDDEPLCLYVAGASTGVAGILLLTVILTYGTQNRNIIEVTDTYVVHFDISHLSASFWCAASSCIISLVICIVFLVATVRPESRHPRAMDWWSATTRRDRRRRHAAYPLEVAQAERNDTFDKGKENKDKTASLCRMPVLNGSYFDVHRQTTKHTVQQNNRNEDDCLNPVFHSQIEVKENEDVKALRNHGFNLSSLTNNCVSQYNPNSVFDETSNSFRFTDPSSVCLNEYQRQIAQIDGISVETERDCNISMDSNNQQKPDDHLSDDCTNSLERCRPLTVVSARKVVAQLSPEVVPRYAWTEAGAYDKRQRVV